MSDDDPAAPTASDDADDAGLPGHIHETLAAIDRLHESHLRGVGPVQRAVDRATRRFARPVMVLALLGCVAAWLLLNLLAPHPPDPPPFPALQLALGVVSVCLTCMILATQRRADQLADNRAHLTLQLALLAERKSAKTIALLEELRRDLPMLGNRADELADELAKPTDAAKVIERLVEKSEETAQHGIDPAG